MTDFRIMAFVLNECAEYIRDLHMEMPNDLTELAYMSACQEASDYFKERAEVGGEHQDTAAIMADMTRVREIAQEIHDMQGQELQELASNQDQVSFHGATPDDEQFVHRLSESMRADLEAEYQRGVEYGRQSLWSSLDMFEKIGSGLPVGLSLTIERRHQSRSVVRVSSGLTDGGLSQRDRETIMALWPSVKWETHSTGYLFATIYHDR